MVAGRKPTPTAIKELRGTAQPCRVNKDEPKSDPMDLSVPKGLRADEKKIWLTEAPGLSAAKILTELDRATFRRYCIVSAEYERLRELVKKEGDTYHTPSGQWKENPHVAMRDRAFDRSERLASLFGKNPSSRTRLSIPEEKEDDPWNDFKPASALN